jgi:integrase
MKGVSSRERKGVVYWYAQINGRKQYCGKDSKGKELAEAARSKFIAKKYENREIHAGLKVKKVQFRSVLEMSNWYMTLPTVQAQKSHWRKIQACRHIIAYFGNMRINQVEADDTERYRELRKGQGAANATINLELAVLRIIYRAAKRRKKIHSDDVPGEFVMVEANNPRRIITDDEFEAIIKAATDPGFKDVLICAYESAMRSSEIASLTAGQVHLNVQHISGALMDYIDLGIFDTKVGARRTVPLSPILKEVLERRLEGLGPQDRVFTSSRGIFTSNRISLRFRKLCEGAGVLYGDKLLNDKGERIGIVFHCFRHTRTTRWVEMGFSDELIRRATGHKSLEAYRNYVKVSDASAVMRLVEKRIIPGQNHSSSAVGGETN